MKQYKREQSGRSMIEMMGYIAVVMALTTSMGYLVSKVYGNYKISKASLQVSDLANVISKAGSIEANYAEIVAMVRGDNTVTINNVTKEVDKVEGRKMIPSSYRVKETDSARQIYHAFGGAVTISHPNDDTSKFAITFANLNRNQCIELAMKDWMHNKYADLYSITINDSTWNWPIYGVASGNSTLPIKRSAVAGVGDNDEGACSDDTSNSIMWVFN